MYPVDPVILAQLGQSHGVIARLTASINRSGFSYPVDLDDGSVSIDGTRAVRRTLSATIRARITDPECDVFRTEIRAEYGIQLPSRNEPIWIPVGTFVLTDAEEADKGLISIKGEDRWRRVVNARFLQPTTTKGKHTLAIISLMQGADSRILCQDTTGSLAQHNTALWARDRDKAVRDLAKSIGAEVSFDPMGAAQIRPIPSLSSAASWFLGTGDGGVLISPRRARTQGNTYNAVVVEGETTEGTPAVRGVATVVDAESTLLFGGGFSQRPRFYRSSLVATQDQANQTAIAMLERVTGVSRTVKIESFVNPALEAGDVVSIEVSSGVWERHIVESFTVPLGLGSMNINTRTSNGEEDGE